MMKKQHVFALIFLWTVLAACAWFSPVKAMSDTSTLR